MASALKLAIGVTADTKSAVANVSELKREIGGLGDSSTVVAAEVNKLKAAIDAQAAAGLKLAANNNTIGATVGNAAKSTALASHEVTNLSYQLTDMGVMLASGQSPFLIMAQQGTQVAQIMGSRGLGSLIPALVGGISSMINPTTLVLGGLTAIGYAGYAAFRAIVPEVESAEEVLKRHEELLGRIKDRYGEAAVSAGSYAKESSAILAAELAQTQSDLRNIIMSSSKDVLGDSRLMFFEEINRLYSPGTNGTPLFAEMQRSIDELAASVERGEPQLRAFRDAWARFEVNPLATESQRELAREIREMTAAGVDADQRLRTLPGTIDAIGQSAGRWVSDINGFNNALEKLSGIAAQPISLRDQALDQYRKARLEAVDLESSRKALEAYEAALKRIANAEAGALVPVPTRKPNFFEYDLPRSTGSSSRRSEADRQRERIDRMGDRYNDEAEKLRLEIALLGQNEDVRRRLLDQLRSEQDIRRAGIGLHSSEAEGLRTQANLVGKLRAELDRSEQAWSRIQDAAGRAIDGLVDGLASGDIKGALLSVGRSLAGSFLDGFKTDLKDGFAALFSGQMGGGFSLGGLFSGLSGIGAFSGSNQLLSAVAGGGVGLWADGGYTGHGGKYEPAGIVHRGEVVWSQRDVARAGGVAVVESLRMRGYAEGGVVDVPQMISAPRHAAGSEQGSSGAGRMHITVGVDVDDNGKLRGFVKEVAQEEGHRAASATVEAYDRNLPDRIENINSRPRWR
ncbi:phage tail length tape measure family protein [Ensifer aridi]|uniref:phage tail length tape measure family protein n=1 Tax=Ensifer aridi TaxID=1708715 RepID=UPI000A110C65|nr:phage tail length tape measure family protein [Ensifer aridi]